MSPLANTKGPFTAFFFGAGVRHARWNGSVPAVVRRRVEVLADDRTSSTATERMLATRCTSIPA